MHSWFTIVARSEPLLCRYYTPRRPTMRKPAGSGTQASLQSTLPASTIFESWLPMDSESSIKSNCSANTRIRQAGAPSATATNAGVRLVIAETGFEHAQTFRHANHLAVAVRQINHPTAALIQRAYAARDQNDSDQAGISNQKIIYYPVDCFLLRSDPNLTFGEIVHFPLRGVAIMYDPFGRLDRDRAWQASE